MAAVFCLSAQKPRRAADHIGSEVCRRALFASRLRPAPGVLAVVYRCAGVLLAFEGKDHTAGYDGNYDPSQQQSAQFHRKKAHKHESAYSYPQGYSLIAVHSSYP